MRYTASPQTVWLWTNEGNRFLYCKPAWLMVMPITFCHQSQTTTVCLMFQRGRSSVRKFMTLQLWIPWGLAGLTQTVISGTHTLTDSRHVQLNGRHKAWKFKVIHHWGRGKADASELNHSPSHHCQGVGGCVTAERNQSLSLNKTKAKIGQNIKVEKKSYSRLIKSLPR